MAGKFKLDDDVPEPQDALTTEEGAQDPEHKDEIVVDVGAVTDDDDPATDDADGPEGTPAPQWVRDLRKQNRELRRDLRETRKQLNSKGPQQAAVETLPTLGAKPKLEDFDFDNSKFEDALARWLSDKNKVDLAKAKADASEAERKAVWDKKLAAYTAGRQLVGASDFADAEASVLEALSQTQQGIIVSGAKDSALVIYALGKNPEKLRALSAITDPVEFAFAVARLEAQVRVVGKKPVTTPESRLVGGASTMATVAGSTSANLERLRTEAEKTGDYSKVRAYKAKLKSQGK